MEDIIKLIQQKLSFITDFKDKLWISRFPSNLFMLKEHLLYADKIDEYTKKTTLIIKNEINQLNILSKDIIELDDTNLMVLKKQIDILIKAISKDSYREQLEARLLEKNIHNQELITEHFLTYILTIKNIDFSDFLYAVNEYVKDDYLTDFFNYISNICKNKQNYKIIIPFNVVPHNKKTDTDDELRDLIFSNNNKDISFHHKKDMNKYIDPKKDIKDKSIKKYSTFINDNENYMSINISGEGISAIRVKTEQYILKLKSLLFKRNKDITISEDVLFLKEEVNQHTNSKKYFVITRKWKLKKYFYFKKNNLSLKIEMDILEGKDFSLGKQIENILIANFKNINNPWFATELIINYFSLSKDFIMRKKIDSFTPVIENIISCSTSTIDIDATYKNDIYLSLNYLYTIRNKSIHASLVKTNLMSIFDSFSLLLNDVLIENLMEFSSTLYKSLTMHNNSLEEFHKLLFIKTLFYKKKIFNSLSKEEKEEYVKNSFLDVPFPFSDFADKNII